MATTALLNVHHCSLGDPSSMAPEQCWRSLFILRGIDYCLLKILSSPPIGGILCLQKLPMCKRHFSYICFYLIIFILVVCILVVVCSSSNCTLLDFCGYNILLFVMCFVLWQGRTASADCRRLNYKSINQIKYSRACLPAENT